MSLFRALLQRISMILTAPPKVTDDDYQRMKKLSTRLKTNEKFEEDLQKKRQEVIIERVKSTSAFYDHVEWEHDYKKQVCQYCLAISYLNLLLILNLVERSEIYAKGNLRKTKRLCGSFCST